MLPSANPTTRLILTDSWLNKASDLPLMQLLRLTANLRAAFYPSLATTRRRLRLPKTSLRLRCARPKVVAQVLPYRAILTRLYQTMSIRMVTSL